MGALSLARSCGRYASTFGNTERARDFHAAVCKTFKYKLVPTLAQERQMFWILTRCRELYNAGLQERRDAWKIRRKSVSYYDQAAQLPGIKEDRPEFKEIHSQVLQDVLKRLDKAMQAFFRRVKTGEKPGYPRFQGRNRYHSFTYPQYDNGARCDNGFLVLSKIGRIGVRRQREDFHHKEALKLVQQNDVIYVEDLQVANMMKNHHLAKSISDAGWAQFRDILTFKAACAGKSVVAVPPHYTSQDCSRCGMRVPKSLSVRTHVCPYCGLVMDRDENGALNVKGAGQARRGAPGILGTQPLAREKIRESPAF